MKISRRSSGLRWGQIALTCLVLAFAGGCTSGVDEVPVQRFPVEGNVTFDGKPVEAGQIVFESKVPGVSATAAMEAGGKFVVKDYKGLGLPGGEYVVYFTAPAPPLPDATNMNINIVPTKFILPQKYLSAKTSKLTATVKEGAPQALKFELTAK